MDTKVIDDVRNRSRGGVIGGKARFHGMDTQVIEDVRNGSRVGVIGGKTRFHGMDTDVIDAVKKNFNCDGKNAYMSGRGGNCKSGMSGNSGNSGKI